MVITAEDVAAAPQQQPAHPLQPYRRAPIEPASLRTSVLAVVAFVLALVGIIGLGIPGLAAIVLGAIAVGSINTNRRLQGIGFATAAIVIGVLDVVGWAVLVCILLLSGTLPLPQEAAPPLPQRFDPEDVRQAPPHIQRAIRANVAVKAHSFGFQSEGSGVVLASHGDRVFVLTNRHVVSQGRQSFESLGETEVTIVFFDGSAVDGSVVWQAPPGLDLLLLACEPLGASFETAVARASSALTVGEEVFAMGNPLGLGWSYSAGAIAAIRRSTYEGGMLRMIQAQLPLNPGNSGGGLYDAQGELIGINTLTTDKASSEGIGFALSTFDMLPLLEAEVGVQLGEGTTHEDTPP